MKALYQIDLLGSIDEEELVALLRNEAAEGADVYAFARELVEGTVVRRAEIDAIIGEVAENWEISRMAVVDRNIIRMAIYEMLWRDDVPPKVAINEAIDLAKKYSTKNSSAFVNGILDKVRQRGGES
jgi:transcription antitermination factor NusB